MSNKTENNNVENAVVEIINKTIQGIDSTTEFLLSEIPEVIQQLIMWNFTKSLCLFLLSLVLVLVSIFYIVKITKGIMNKNNNYVENEGYTRGDVKPIAVAAFSFHCVTLLIFFLLLTESCDWLMIWIAPKVWLIEYAANLVK